VVAVHSDAVVVTSRLWQTTATALRAGGEAMLIDSPYFPDELEVLPQVLGQSGFEVDALVATHGDWDHVLGRLAYPGMSLGVAESTAIRLREEPGVAQLKLRNADDEHYVARERPLALGAWQSLPVPGKLELGGHELELHPAEGHTRDGMAVFARHMGVLVCGDYLSDVEIPTVEDRGLYRGTLERLRPLVEAADVVVPGHGSPMQRDEALRILEEDLAYLDGLEAGDARLPEGRDTPVQRRMHEQNAVTRGV
jgi:glyoxylase-like metal-dependent hydrolase (beta-lactamase superfamily II)